MKGIRRCFTEFYAFIMNFLLFFPLLIMAQRHMTEGLKDWYAVLYILPCTANIIVGRLLHGQSIKKAVTVGAIASVLLPVFAITQIPANNLSTYILYILLFPLTYAMFLLPFITGSHAITGRRLTVGGVLYIIAVFAGGTEKDAYTTPLAVSAGAFLIAGLFTFNSENLWDAAKPGKGAAKLPNGMRSSNILVVSGFVLLAVLLASFEKIKAVVGVGILYIIRLILMIMAFIASLAGGQGTGGGEGGGGSGDMFLPGDTKTTSMFWETVVKIVVIVALVAFALLILYLLYKLANKLIKALPNLIDSILGRISPHLDDLYSDEAEKLRGENLGGELTDGVKKLWDKLTYRAPKYADMPDNRARVRFVYKRMIKDMSRWERRALTDTPNELKALSTEMSGQDTEKFIDVYNKARYTEKEITDADTRIAYDLYKTF